MTGIFKLELEICTDILFNCMIEEDIFRLKEVLQAYDKLQEERKTDKTKIRNPREIEMRREKDSNLQRYLHCTSVLSV